MCRRCRDRQRSVLLDVRNASDADGEIRCKACPSRDRIFRVNGRLADRARYALSDPSNPASLSSRARSRRWQQLNRCFPDLAEMRVLDLGGLPSFWTKHPRPAAVTTVNLEDADTDEPGVTHVVADACEPGALVSNERFDLVVSNSVLEHVGGYHRRRQLAEVVLKAADRHWVQTPNRYFPIEPHYLAPGWQFLPIPARATILRHWPLAHGRPTDRADALDNVLSTELVSRAELQLLFPQSEIWSERLLGLAKSLVAVHV